jgi:hypothetical protein
MDEYKRPFRFANGKFPGFIGLTRSQYYAVTHRQMYTALNLGLSYDDYMSLLYRNFSKKESK